jgi:hypothetical protein
MTFKDCISMALTRSKRKAVDLDDAIAALQAEVEAMQAQIEAMEPEEMKAMKAANDDTKHCTSLTNSKMSLKDRIFAALTRSKRKDRDDAIAALQTKITALDQQQETTMKAAMKAAIKAATKAKDDAIKEKDDAIKEKDEEIALLKQQSKKKDSCYVFGTSSAAYDKDVRKEFRTRFIHGNAMQGTFVSSQFYTEFVKGARRMKRDPDEKRSTTFPGLQCIAEDKKWGEAVEYITEYGQRLLKSYGERFPEYPDCEKPQSDILAKLIERALRLLAGNQPHGIEVTHQYDVSINANPEEVKNSIGNCNGKSEVYFFADVVVWVEDSQRGRIELAVFEFKPDDKNQDARRAQVDMNVANILAETNLPCIAVDVTGGRNFDAWTFCASAPVPNETNGVTDATYVKSFVLASQNKSGEAFGADGIVRLAAGILRSRDFVKAPPLELLGPVVAIQGDGKQVVKAYHDSEYCRHNIGLVRTLIDSDALRWTSRDDSLVLVETRYFESDWMISAKVSAFVEILCRLKDLHDNRQVHGDMRLANMLSSGVLIDLDYVGAQKYPPGYQNVKDGRRHMDVQAAITNGTIGDLPIVQAHDLFSMGAVMQFFTPAGECYVVMWERACNELGKGNGCSLTRALSLLRKLAKDDVSVDLTSESRQSIFADSANVFGTGGTPPKRKMLPSRM